MCFMVVAAVAQKKKKEDVEAIMSMAGCFKVNFDYSETFASDTAYQFHDNYSAWGYELVLPIEESKDKISLQHLLIVMDTMVIKHWRQDWIYENTDLYSFDKERSWNYAALPADQVKGQWTQKVFQVDDSPRYEGSASWVHVDGKHYWESDVDAPLPRREFSKRSDYNVMRRGNRHEIYENGWDHEQDNLKIVRTEDLDNLLAQEKGLNTYRLVDEEVCQPARDWWQKNQVYWTDVRATWDELFSSKQSISIKGKVDDKILFQSLFALEKEMMSQSYDSNSAKQKIRATIQSYLNTDQKLVSKN